MPQVIDLSEDLVYSAEDQNVLHEFYDCQCIIYVEGKDDALFWKMVCEFAEINDVHIEDVGGNEELEKKLMDIKTKNVFAVVAYDADFSAYEKSIDSHPFIVRTYGYSIENTMYCASSLNSFVRKLSRSLDDYEGNAKDWSANFVESCKPLLLYGIANARFARGVPVFGNNCTKFLKSGQSVEVCKQKVDAFIASFSAAFSATEIAECEELLKQETRPLETVIKGHFITCGVRNWLKSISGTSSISDDILYAGTIDGCQKCRKNSACAHLKFMSDSVRSAVDNVVMARESA